MSRPRAAYVFQLQAIRGVAALVVAIYHCTFAYAPRGIWVEIYRSIWNVFYGVGAVFTFFILSGFVLGLSLEKHHYYTLSEVRLFLIRRFWRLWPAMIIISLIYEIYGALSDTLFSKYLSNFTIHAVSFPALCYNLILFNVTLNHVTWSLRVEWLFSLIVPFTFLWTHKNPAGNLVLIIIGLLFYYFLNGERFHLNAPDVAWCYLFMCYAGMALAAYKKEIVDLYRRIDSRFLYVAVGISFLICVTTVHFGNHADLYTLAMTFLIGCVISERMSHGFITLLNLKPLIWLGNVSYSFYLLHPLMLSFCSTLFHWLATRNFVDEHFFLFDILVAVCSIALTAPLAALSFRFFERPFLKP